MTHSLPFKRYIPNMALSLCAAVSLFLLTTSVTTLDSVNAQTKLTESETTDFSPCHIKGVEELAQCALIAVPENYADPGGASISLNVAILPPSGGQPNNDPLYFLAGGPGQAATELGIIYDRLLRRARRGRELILIDQRGTGKSSPFTCRPDNNPLANGGDVARNCLSQTENNPAFYTSDSFIKDLEFVRARLGHEKISLMGVSYGTRAALLYAKAHHPRVRAMILDSVAPPHIPIFSQEANYASNILTRSIADCKNSEDCNTAFPNLDAEFESLLNDLSIAPVSVTIPDTDNIAFDVDRNLFLMGFRGALYSPVSTRLIPYIISQARAGNFSPWLALSDFGAQEVNGGISLGLLLSVQCAEEYALLANTPPNLEDNLYPSSLDLFFTDACAVWPNAVPPAGFNDPVTVDTPTLLLSGALDPITPPALAEAAAEYLSNSVHLIADHAGHSVISYGCANILVAEFLEHNDPAKMDGACLKKISTPPFTAAVYGPKP